MKYPVMDGRLPGMLMMAVLTLTVASCSVTRFMPPQYPELPGEFKAISGQLETVVYPTPATGPSQRRMYVYLPEGYSDTCGAYPVLYLLHGARGSEASWITEGNVLPRYDSLVACGSIRDMIVVFPNMNSYDDDGDFAKSRRKGALESFFEVDGCVESFFVADIVGTVDSLFHTVQAPGGRAIAGLSVGGMQAMHIAASRPDIFGYAGIFSSPVHSFIKKGPCSGFYGGLDVRLDAISPKDALRWDIYVGRRDIYRASMKKFCRRLGRKGLPYMFHLEEGGHQWTLWTSFACSFMQNVFIE